MFRRRQLGPNSAVMLLLQSIQCASVAGLMLTSNTPLYCACKYNMYMCPCCHVLILEASTSGSSSSRPACYAPCVHFKVFQAGMQCDTWPPASWGQHLQGWPPASWGPPADCKVGFQQAGLPSCPHTRTRALYILRNIQTNPCPQPWALPRLEPPWFLLKPHMAI